MAAKTVDKLGKNMAEFLAGLHSHFILIKIVYALAARASTPLFINRLRKTRIEQPILRSTGVFFFVCDSDHSIVGTGNGLFLTSCWLSFKSTPIFTNGCLNDNRERDSRNSCGS